MLSCNQVQKLFSEIYDGVAKDMTHLTKHIQECPVCRAEYASYSQFLDEVRQLPEPELPFYFHELSMRNISEHVPPNDHVIDELIEGIKKRERLRDKRQKRTRKASQATTRWAGIAIAACLLIISIFTVRAFDMTSRLASRDSYDAAPAAVAAEMEIIYDIPDDAPLMGAAQYDASAEAAPDMDFSSDLFDDIMPEMALPADVPTEWGVDMEHNISLESADEIQFYDDEPLDNARVRAGEYGEFEPEDYDGYTMPLPATDIAAGVAEQTTDGYVAQTTEETQAVAESLETFELSLNGGSPRAWPFAVFGGVGLTCIVAILFFIRARQK